MMQKDEERWGEYKSNEKNNREGEKERDKERERTRDGQWQASER